MVVQGLPPGMQHRKEADVRDQIVRVARHGQEGLSHSLQEKVIHHPRVLERERTEEMREGKHHMDVGDIEQLHFTGREPGGLRPAWTLGAMPMATGIIGDLHVPALLTLRRGSSQSRSPAESDRSEGALPRSAGHALPEKIG